MSIAIMICYARSGGTLLNRCLGAMPNTVVLSEVNPLGGGGQIGLGVDCVRRQAKEWYQIDLRGNSFQEAIVDLHDICQRTGRKLIIRDWPYVNFVPLSNNQNHPPNRFLILEALQPLLPVQTFGLVRNGIDVWISRKTPKPQDFFPQYLRYVLALKSAVPSIFRYEDLCRSPDGVMRDVCDSIGLPFSDGYKNFHQFDSVYGDSEPAKKSRAFPQRQFIELKRRKIGLLRAWQVRRSDEMSQANRLLGYSSALR